MQAPDHGRKSSATPRFAAAALGTFGTQLGVAMLSFASVLVVARTLGPTGRGDVAFLITIAVLSSTFALLGVDEANINFAGRRPELRRALATNSLLLALALGAACIAIVVLLIWAVPAVGGEADADLRWIAYAAIPVLTLKVYLKFLVRADYHFAIANVAWLLPPSLTLVANVALALAGRLTVGTAVTAWFTGHVLATLLLMWFVARRSAGFGRPDLALVRRTLGFGWRSHLGRVMMAGNYRLDQWFVGALAGSRELGLYSIAVSLAEILFYLPTALTIAQRPYLVRVTKDEAGRRAARVLRASVMVTIACAGALALIAPLAVPLLFGSGFSGGVDDLQILAAGTLGILMLKLLGNALTAQDRPGLATAGATAAFAVTLVLDAALIPSLGGSGAALASTLAYSTGGVAIVVIFLRHFGLPPRVLLPRPAELPHVARALGRSLRRRPSESRAT